MLVCIVLADFVCLLRLVVCLRLVGFVAWCLEFVVFGCGFAGFGIWFRLFGGCIMRCGLLWGG